MTGSQPIADFPLMRAAVSMGLVWLIVVGATVGLVALLGKSAQIVPSLATAIVCLLAALAALLPVYWRAPHAPEGAAQGFLIGMVLRMVVCLAAVLALAALAKMPVAPLALWTLLWYLLLLVVEVALLVGYLRRRDLPANPLTEDAV